MILKINIINNYEKNSFKIQIEKEETPKKMIITQLNFLKNLVQVN